jgi:nitrite reductase/ring-hydroxylating ferredoxin subunit
VSGTRVASLDEIPAGQPRLVEVHGVRVVLARVGDAVYACGDVCAHRGGPLSEGKLSGARLACPWHGWMYDVRTGQCAFPGRGASVPTYPVRIEGNDVFVETGGSGT